MTSVFVLTSVSVCYVRNVTPPRMIYFGPLRGFGRAPAGLRFLEKFAPRPDPGALFLAR